jgi:hypothetical protein
VKNPLDAADLETFFGPAGCAGRSTFGATLDRQALRYQTSDGQVVDTRRIRVVQRELSGSTEEAPRYAQILTPWPWAPVRREVASAVEEDEDQLERTHRERQVVARVSRRLARLSPRARAVLELLYGDHGVRWAPVRWGRIWAVVPCTRPAQRTLERDTAERRERGRPAPSLPPAERLALLAEVRPRPEWVDLALDLAERLAAEACEEWERTDG